MLHRLLSKLLLLAAPAAVAAGQCIPAPTQAAFFQHDNFRSPCVIRDIGSYPTAISTGLANDSITSIRLGAAVQVLACRDHHYAGTCELITRDVVHLRGHPVGNDEITSFKVQPLNASTDCSPADAQVAFYRDVNYSGPCEVRGPGVYETSEAIGLINDSISSFRVGSSAQVIVCRDTSFRGDCQLFTSSVASMHGQRIGNDSISSARVQSLGTQECTPGSEQVAFFVHSGFVPPCSVRGRGTYADAVAMGVPNDSLSSVLVGPGAQAVVCVDANFGGDCERLTASDEHLRDNRIGNDRGTSAKVQRAGELECEPRSTQVAFFKHSDFTAPCSTRDIGEYPNASAMGMENDSISSIVAGGGVQAILCVHTDYWGDCQKFTGRVASLGGSAIGHDRTSSARVQPMGMIECPPEPDQVALYAHRDYLAPCVVRDIGDYPNAAAFGLPNNELSSVRIGSEVQVCLCDGDNFGRTCEAITASDAWLGDDFDSIGGGNDIVSSLKVQPRGAECKATTAPESGFSRIEIMNCSYERRTVHIWICDLTAGTPCAEAGLQASNWSSSGSCTNGAPFVVELVNGHWMRVIAVDTGLVGCTGNDPNVGACRKLTSSAVRGLASGPALPLTVN